MERANARVAVATELNVGHWRRRVGRNGRILAKTEPKFARISRILVAKKLRRSNPNHKVFSTIRNSKQVSPLCERERERIMYK